MTLGGKVVVWERMMKVGSNIKEWDIENLVTLSSCSHTPLVIMLFSFSPLLTSAAKGTPHDSISPPIHLLYLISC